MKTTAALSALGLGFVVSLAACGDDEATFSDDSGGSSGTGAAGTGGGTGGGTLLTNVAGAAGVTVTQVAIYQGPKRTLAENGAVAASTVPLVQGRDALLRIFYTAEAGQVGQTVVGRLERDGFDPIDMPHVLTGASTDEDGMSTVGFLIPGSEIGANFSYRVSINVEGDPASGNPGAAFPIEGFDTHAVEGPANKLRVIFAPYAYNADGSGRVPDIVSDPNRLEAYRTRFKQLYPVSDVEVSVREPIQWAGSIQPNGAGWQEVGFNLFGLRGQDGTSADVYYYGIFNPAASFQQFCGFGCLLGVTLLNNNPPDVGDPGLRLALGVGFPEVGADTAAHELGHSHGREHAPCGPGLDPNSIDASFPHAGGGIGPWSYDIVNMGLVNPAGRTDIMGYCDNQWISDYNYIALLNRGKNVNLPKWQAPAYQSARDLEIVAVDGDGTARFMGEVRHPLPRAEANVHVSLVTADGHASLAQATYHRFDHLPGGWLVYEKPAFEAAKAEATVDGRLVQATRQ